MIRDRRLIPILLAVVLISPWVLAQSETLVVENDKVGIGVTVPTHKIHVVTSSPNVAQFQSTESANNVAFLFIQNNRSSDFNQTGIGSYFNALILRAGDATRLTVQPDGSLTSSTGASLTAGGVWMDSSSRARKHDVSALQADDALAAFAELQPVTFRYDAEPDEQHVGFIAEDVPELVATKDRSGLAPMEIVAVLTEVVRQQQAKIDALSSQVASLVRAVPETQQRSPAASCPPPD